VICLKFHVRENSVNEVVVRFLSLRSNYELGQWRCPMSKCPVVTAYEFVLADIVMRLCAHFDAVGWATAIAGALNMHDLKMTDQTA